MPPPRKAAHDAPTLFPIEAEAPEPEELGPAAGLFAQVALNRPMRCEYTYAVPDELAEGLEPGMRVAVRFHRGRQVGVVVGLSTETDVSVARLRPIAKVLDEEPVVDQDLLDLTRWMAERWACSWGEALAAVLPAPLKRESGTRKVLQVEAAPGVGATELEELEERFPKQHRVLRTVLEAEGPVELRDLLKRMNLSDSPARTLARRGWIRITSVEVEHDELSTSRARRERPERLTPDQERAVDRSTRALGEGGGTFLLQGVTGSGKTEVYLRVIERALELGRSAVVLVPEIALTPQTVGWFRSRFGEVCVLHSRLTDSQRLQMWRRARRGETRVVVGARSAIFAPVPNLGVVVVDEEHEPSFKQGNTPRYHAREVAMERARRAGAVCLLGSATPSLETWTLAQAAGPERIERLLLPTRIGGVGLPPVDIVDMRLELERSREAPLFSNLLSKLLKEAVEEGEQAILFLNRRGFTPILWCPGCKETVRCQQCDVSLTLHRRIQRLVCHGCCEERAVPAACPSCTRPGIKAFGAGSERVERDLERLLPRARVRRMDSDTMRRREDYETALEAFGRGEVDVLVGTQMIAKGLDFPGVTVVGIVSADQGLHLPDFRASERTFQLVAQVAGRAGRGERPGRIVVQTIAPLHPAIVHAAQHDFEAFAAEESALRAELGYPPHGRLLRAVFDEEDEARVVEAAEDAARALRPIVDGTAAVLLGPAPAPIAWLRGRHRHHLLLKCPTADPTFERARDALVEATASMRVRVGVDVDPTSML